MYAMQSHFQLKECSAEYTKFHPVKARLHPPQSHCRPSPSTTEIRSFSSVARFEWKDTSERSSRKLTPSGASLSTPPTIPWARCSSRLEVQLRSLLPKIIPIGHSLSSCIEPLTLGNLLRIEMNVSAPYGFRENAWRISDMAQRSDRRLPGSCSLPHHSFFRSLTMFIPRKRCFMPYTCTCTIAKQVEQALPSLLFW